MHNAFISIFSPRSYLLSLPGCSGFIFPEQRMCPGTFSRLRRSLATSTLYIAVRIPAERFLLYRKAISCKVKHQIPAAHIHCRNLLILICLCFPLTPSYIFGIFYSPAIAVYSNSRTYFLLFQNRISQIQINLCRRNIIRL